jgi:hypothetical protein
LKPWKPNRNKNPKVLRFVLLRWTLKIEKDRWSDVSTDGVDGLHLTSESEKKLGAAVAAKVKEILK